MSGSSEGRYRYLQAWWPLSPSSLWLGLYWSHLLGLGSKADDLDSQFMPCPPELGHVMGVVILRSGWGGTTGFRNGQLRGHSSQRGHLFDNGHTAGENRTVISTNFSCVMKQQWLWLDPVLLRHSEWNMRDSEQHWQKLLSLVMSPKMEPHSFISAKRPVHKPVSGPHDGNAWQPDLYSLFDPWGILHCKWAAP